MALINLFKKKEEKKAPTCCCSAEPKTEERTCCCSSKEEPTSCCCSAPVDGICCIKVLGAGCKSCHQQYENVKAAVKNLGHDVEVEYITDMEKIMEYGIMSMPAIVVNDKVVAFGKVLKATDVENLLKG